MKLLPDSIKNFLINRFLEASGVTSIILSLFILLSMITYSSFDPNIYHLNNHEVVNFGGTIGASISEVLLQAFGYSSFLICIILISWSYKLFFTKNLELFALNFLLLPFTVLLLSMIFKLINLPISSGFLAVQIFEVLNNTNFLAFEYINYLSIVFLFIIFFVSLYFTMGLNVSEWKSIFIFIWTIIIK